MQGDVRIFSRSDLSNLIGKRIRKLRNEKGISQAELGRICGKDRQHMELIENSKVSPNVYTLYLIATALGMQLDELLDLK